MRLLPPEFSAALVLGGLSLSAAGADNPDFYQDVFPFLKANCISCHNKTTTKAGLNMETPELMKKGGDSGPGIVPGKSSESLLVEASVHTEDLEMPPPNNKSGAVNLSPAEISVLKTWIDQGAKASVQQERQVTWKPLAPGVDPIYSVALTQDGRYAVCGRSNRLFLYDLATRQFVSEITDPAEKAGGAHRAMVQSLAFNPDGTRLASGSFREVKIWKLEGGSSAARAADATLGLTMSFPTADGKMIVGADKAGAILIMDAISGKLVRKMDGVSPSGIKLLGVSPDASKALVYATDGTLSLRSLADGKVLANQAGVVGVHALTWLVDGKSFATAGEDKIIRVWSLPAPEVQTFPAPKELKGAAGTIKQLAAGSDADRLVSSGEDGKIRVWSLSQAKVAHEIATGGVLQIALSADGKSLVTGSSDGVARVWDIATGKAVIELRGSPSLTKQITAFDWTIARETLEQAFQKTEVARIEAQNKALDELLKKANDAIVEMKKALPEKQKAVKPTQDAKAVAKKAVDDVLALIAKAPGGKADAALEKQLKDAQEKLGPVAMTETSALAAVSATENNIKDAEAEVKRITEAKAKNTQLLASANAAVANAKKTQDKATADLAAARQAASKQTAKPVAVALSTDGQRVASFFDDGKLIVWAVATGTPLEQEAGTAASAGTLACRSDGRFTAIAFDGRMITSSSAPRWVLERLLGGENDHSLFVDRVNALRFSPDGKLLAAGGGEPSRTGDITLFDPASGKATATWKERHDDIVMSLDFSPDGKRLASGAADKIVRVTEIASGKQVNLLEGHTHYVMGVAFRADGRVLASAGADGVVTTWDMILGERKKKIEGWTKEVTLIQFIGATNQIVTSAGDNRVRIVNDDGGEVRSIAGLPDFMQAAASTANGATLIGGGEDSTLRVWNGADGKELAAFGMK